MFLGNTHKVSMIASKESIIRDGLVLYLDAGNSNSYPGTGTVWYDLSGNNNNFNIVSTAYNSAGKYMDFSGSHGCAKNGSDISLDDSNGVTYLLLTRVLNSNANWRTLTRSYVADHHVIIEYNNWNIGMYDNNGGNFQSTGFSQLALPNFGTSNWAFLHWRWKNTAPYYEFSYNDTPETIRGSLSTTQSRYNRGFGSIGAYHEANTTPSSASQFWGDIAVFLCYNRRLSNNEILQNYNALKTFYESSLLPYENVTYTTSTDIVLNNNGGKYASMFRVSGSASWNRSVYSTQAFTAPCTIEFYKNAATTDNGASYAMIGWNEDPTTNASYDTLDYAAYPYRTDTYSVHHNGTQVHFSGSWNPANKFYLVYDTDGYIRHYNGSTLLYSANYGTGKTVYVDTSFYAINYFYSGFYDVRVIKKSWNGSSYV